MSDYKQELKSNQGVLGVDPCISTLRYERSVVVFLSPTHSPNAEALAAKLTELTGWATEIKPFRDESFVGNAIMCKVQDGWGLGELLSTDFYEWYALTVATVQRVIPEAKYWE
jgi:hypothetical protein